MQYDIAQICLNGHVINDSFQDSPGLNKDFCPDCGNKTIIKCLHCDHYINGGLHSEYSFSSLEEAPKFCSKCGQAYPWTEEKLKAANELADLLDELSEEERNQLKISLDDLVKDGPRTVVATTKFKRILSKTGPEIVSGFREILVDVVSETVKKSIWG